MGEILNEKIDWHTLPSSGGQTREEIYRAFWGGAARKVLLAAGFAVYKLHNFKTVASDASPKTAVSAWWAPYNSFEDDPGFNERFKLSKHFGASLREVARVYLAVSENWNSFQFLLVARLAQPTFGFYGTVSGQERLQGGQPSKRAGGEGSGGTAGLPGHGRQIYIPSLTVGNLYGAQVYRVEDIENGVTRLPPHM